MLTIPVGAKGSFSLTVTPEHLASRFKDATLPPVLATPVMIMVMENAALNAIKPDLEAGETALGTRVDVRHLAATPAGRPVMGDAEVTRVDGRKIEFSVSASDAAGADRRRHARAHADRQREARRWNEGEIREFLAAIRLGHAFATHEHAKQRRAD